MSSWNQGPFNRNYNQNYRAQPLDYGQAASPAIATFFTAVYGWMSAGLALSAAVAWVIHEQDIQISRGTLLILFIAEIGLVIAISGAVNRIGATAATFLFLLYSALNGVTLSGFVMSYAHATLASTFIVTAGTFGAMSLYGMVTHRDLTRYRNLLFMALIGVILATLVSMFFANSPIYWLINYMGVLLFVGLTAYDTQRIKSLAFQTSGDAAMAARYSIVGALTLYLDFLNLFLFLLQILGNNARRR